MGAPTFSITDGTTTVTLNTGGYYTLFYSASKADVSDPSSGGDGGVLTESLDLLVTGASEAAVKTAIRALEAMVASVFVFHAGGVPVYIQVQYDTDTGPWRAKLYNASVIAPNLADEIWKRQVNVNFSFVRDAAWEGPEAEVAISAASQSAATGGRTVTFNTTSNYISIAAGVIDGVLPAFTRITFQNKTGGTRYYTRLYVGNNVFSSPATFGYAIQGETFVNYGLSTANAGAVGGLVSRITVPTTPPVQVNAGYQLSGTTMLNLARGRRFNLLGKLTDGAGANLKANVVLSYSSVFLAGYTIWKSNDLILPSGFYFDFGSIPLPPAKNVANTYKDLYLGIRFWRDSGSTIDLDYLFFMGTDSFVIAETPGQAIANNDYIELNSIDGSNTLLESGLRSNFVFVKTGVFRVYPAVEQRIHFFVDDSSTAAITHTASVRLYYRPRRFSI